MTLQQVKWHWLTCTVLSASLSTVIYSFVWFYVVNSYSKGIPPYLLIFCVLISLKYYFFDWWRSSENFLLKIFFSVVIGHLLCIFSVLVFKYYDSFKFDKLFNVIKHIELSNICDLLIIGFYFGGWIISPATLLLTQKCFKTKSRRYI